MADEQNQSILLPVDIEAEMRKSYLDYAMSVIIGRALPDVRDGLKPVHRRILFGMYELGLTSNRPYRKCAKIVGEVLGKYHPHGDAPCTTPSSAWRRTSTCATRWSMARATSAPSMEIMPAAMRYTEARLAKIAEELLADIEKETVDFIPNFDQTDKEPVVLPTRVPNLLVNGASGIAVGMATNIPPHNLREIVDATIALIEKPDTYAQRNHEVRSRPGSSRPAATSRAGKASSSAYKTGRGSFIMRAKAAIEEAGKDRENIVITEIPYQVNKARLIERIAELVSNKKIEGHFRCSRRIRPRRHAHRHRAEARRRIAAHPQQSFQAHPDAGILRHDPAGHRRRPAARNGLARVDPPVHRSSPRRGPAGGHAFELRKAEEREHILVGYQIALDHLDKVIRIIRGSAPAAPKPRKTCSSISPSKTSPSPKTASPGKSRV